MIIPTETVLTPSVNIVDNGKLILKDVEKDHISASTHTVSTYTGSSVFELDFSTHEFTSESTRGPIVTPAPRPILKREGSSGSGKSVGFDSVKIRSYNQTMGDNPCVSYGPPIQLDWDYEEQEDICIEKYEAERVFSRRSMRQLVISYYRRKAVLTREYGFSEEELVKAKKDAEKIKFKRAITNTLLPAMHVEAVIESAGRKAKRIIGKAK